MASNGSTALEVAEAHARLRQHGEIQFDLPTAQQQVRAPPPKWLDDLFQFLSHFSQPILWTLAALAVGLVLWVAYRMIRGTRDRDVVPDAQAEVAAWRPEEKVARELLAEAEAMAAAGRYAEAAHLLLHRSLEDIARRRPKLLRPALTSREIARVAALPGQVRGAFAAMAAPVERSLFGGRSLARTDWEEARDAYRAFALPGAWA